MLFDLQGKRKRFIQVIYVFLALLLGGGLVLFGIGGDASGGLGDALGLGGNSSSGDPRYEQEIETANETLAGDPDNAEALLTVARYSYLNGQQALEIDEEQGVEVLTEESIAGFEDAIDAWERYLDANQGKADAGVAALIIRAYGAIAFNTSSPATIQRRLEGAQSAAEVVAEDLPGANSYFELASAAYLAGDTKTAEKAADEALELVDDAGRVALESRLKAAKRQGKQLQKQLKNASSGGGDLEDPLGALGGGTLAPEGEEGG